MRAVVLQAYGSPDGLAFVDLPLPTPGAHEIRVRVHATTVCRGDTEIRSMDLPWLFAVPLRLWLGVWRPRPGRVLGMELAGVVDALGEGVTGLAVGDRVFGMSATGFGAQAEHVCVKASAAVRMPQGLTFEQAATLPVSGAEAVGYLRKAALDGSKRLLIRGASGSIGTYAVQLAKRKGAHVTAVCGPQGVARMRALGADVVLDYTVQDFDVDEARYDAMIDIVGRTPLQRCLAVLVEGGTLVRCTVPGLGEVLTALWLRLTTSKRVRLGEGGGGRTDLIALAEWVASGEVEAVIDRRYPLAAMPEAHRYVETGHKQGHVVIEVLTSEV